MDSLSNDFKKLNLQNFFEQDEDGDTVLMKAIIYEKLAIARYILLNVVTHEAEVNMVNTDRQTALHLAVKTRMKGIVRLLVAHGAAVDVRDKFGDTPLHIACRYVDAAHFVSALTTPLAYSETCKRVYVTYKRIPQDMCLRNYSDESCLGIALKQRNFALADHLIHSCGAELHEDLSQRTGATALHNAVEDNDAIRLLYILNFAKSQQILNAQRYDGYTALDIATVMQNCRFAAILRAHGARAKTDTDDDDCNNDFVDCDIVYDDFRISGKPISLHDCSRSQGFQCGLEQQYHIV